MVKLQVGEGSPYPLAGAKCIPHAPSPLFVCQLGKSRLKMKPKFSTYAN